MLLLLLLLLLLLANSAAAAAALLLLRCVLNFFWTCDLIWPRLKCVGPHAGI